VAGSRRDVAGPRKGWESGDPRSKDHQSLRKRGVHPSTARRLAAGRDEVQGSPRAPSRRSGSGAGRRRDLRGRHCAAGGSSARSERISHGVGRQQAHVGRADAILPQRTGNTLTSGSLSADRCEALRHRATTRPQGAEGEWRPPGPGNRSRTTPVSAADLSQSDRLLEHSSRNRGARTPRGGSGHRVEDLPSGLPPEV
jgi:hypothetical protein